MKAKNFPHEYCAKVVSCLIYILNHFPNKSLKEKVPQEAYSSLKSSASHFF